MINLAKTQKDLLVILSALIAAFEENFFLSFPPPSCDIFKQAPFSYLMNLDCV